MDTKTVKSEHCIKLHITKCCRTEVDYQHQS